MLSSHLFHFAMVHEKFAQTGDIVTGLLPLFSPILEGKEGDEFDPVTFCDDVRNTYGIEMHPYVAEDLSTKLVENGILTVDKQGGRAEKRIITSVPVVKDKDLQSNIHSILQKYEEFSKSFLQKNGLESKSINFANAFTSRLARVDSFGEVATSSEKSINNALDYTFVRFVDLINQQGGKLKDSLKKLYSGSLLSEVVLSIQEPSMDEKSINGKLFYIDMPVLLNVLGLNDEYSVDCSRKLLSLITELGGIVTTTRQYIEEAETAISLSLENKKNRGKRTTSLDRYLFKHSDHVLQARLVSNKVKNTLEKNHQFVLDDSMTNISGHLQSRKALELRDCIARAINWYKKDIARTNDAEAVAYVVVRHGYNSIKNVAESTTFLVTPNEPLVSAANKVLYELDTFKRHEMTPLLTEKKLAMMLWVTSGGKGEDVSSLALISSCTRAMEMHRDISENMERFIKNLPEDKVQQYEDVICNDRALYCLLDEVGFDAHEVPVDDAEEYLLKARDKFYQEQKDIIRNHTVAVQEAEQVAANAIEHRNKAINVVKEKANENLTKDKRNSELQSEVESLMMTIEREKRDKEKLNADMINLESKVNALSNAQDENERNAQKESKRNAEKFEKWKKDLENQVIADKDIVKNRVYSSVRKTTEFIVIVSLVIAIYNLSNLVVKDPIETEFFTLKPALVSLLSSVFPLLFTWKFPDFILGGIVRKVSIRIARLILKDKEYSPVEDS